MASKELKDAARQLIAGVMAKEAAQALHDEAAEVFINAVLSAQKDALVNYEGQGKGNPPQGLGGTDECTCPNCGVTTVHKRGTPCTDTPCPQCGTKMMGGPSKEAAQSVDSVDDLLQQAQDIINSLED